MTTTSKVDIYIETMNKATEAMKAMDEQIISKEQERNKALEELADRINDIANAVDNMRDAFDALDENAIISRFDGLKELLEAAGLVSKEDENEVEGNGENTSRRETSQRPVTRRQSRTTSDELVPRTSRTPRTYEERPQRTYSSGTVHFDFRNYQLSGTYTFTQ
jgi:ABC-type transporter Mla subunit MlaD